MKNKVMKNEEVKDVKKVEVVFLLDRSGSMCGLEADTIGGFNANLQKQKNEEGEVIWSTVLFDDRQEVIHNRLPIQNVAMLSENEYYVRGSTALLDAIGKAINHIGSIHKFANKEDIPDKTLFVITTDGMENASEEYSYALVNKMIQRQTEKYGWEFVFLGANMDAVSVAARMGIRAERSATFHNDSVGIGTNYTAVSRIMDSLRFKEEFDDDALEEIRRDYQKRK